MTSAGEIADALDRLVAAAHRQRAAAAAARDDLNATDLLALDIVRRKPAISPGALAHEMHLTAGGVNGVIRRLIRANMLVRKTSSKDRRDVRLTLARRAETLMTTGIGGWDSNTLESLAQLPDPQATEMMNLLSTLATVTEQRADDLAETALGINDSAREVPRPVRWG
jgi:DNA-binding MarR family transcriptional regulator